MFDPNAPRSKLSIQQLQDLIKKKDAIEVEVNDTTNWLLLPGNFGLQGGLIDKEGFPIPETEKIIAVKEARGKLACLRNDHAEIMKVIEYCLLNPKESVTLPENTKVGVTEAPSGYFANTIHPHPIALFDSVSQFSPAFIAGIRQFDALVKVGDLTKENFTDLNDIRSIIFKNEGKELNLTVQRKKLDQSLEHVNLTLVPQKWAGPGLLGCHVLPHHA